MEQRTNSPYPRRDRPLLAFFGLLLVAAVALLFWAEPRQDWRYWQNAFRAEVARLEGSKGLETLPRGIQQVWLKDLGRADRCVTCHQATAWKGFEKADHPLRTHPPEILATHPVESFGCTSCHGGQGWAVDPDAAHGPARHWEEPVLGAVLGESYSLAGDRGALLQMNCNVCHRYDRATKGAAAINTAKQIVQEKGCRACHVINGRGGSIGPDLTWVGDKAPEQYDYSRMSGHKTIFAWHVAHLKEPKALVAESVMPNFGLTTKEAQALAILLMSWRHAEVPARLRPETLRQEAMTADELAAEERMRSGPGAWFVKTGCFVCHSVSSLGVKSPAQIGPDLAIAVEDVPARFGRSLEDFLREPTGTMSVVLSRQIILTPDQKQVAIAKLKEAYAEHKRLAPAGPAAVTH